MRSIITAVVGLALAGGMANAAWTLIWSDEFDGSSIDPANWEHMLGDGSQYGLSGWGNNELQWYTSDASNSYVTGGALHIVAIRDFPEPGFSYSSARLRSRGLRDFQYGRFEGRIKLPSGQGIWPAFWMLPTNSPYGGWAASGEIDIVESVNFSSVAHGTVHFGGAWPQNVSNGGSYGLGEDVSANFHVYAIEWEEDEIRWYVDGAHYHTVTSAQWWSANGGGNPRAPFDNPFHFLLNVAVGGNWPGPPNGAVGFPMEMVVDYVRVYQDAPVPQDPFHGVPSPIPGQIEAEDYDIGGQGVAYNDADATNNGGAYRTTEGVDLEASTGSGYNVGWVREGEWTEFTVDVAQAGAYTLDVSVASQSTGGIYHLEFDGVDKTGILTAPVTGGWQTWTTISTTVTLDAGEQIMRFVNDGGASSEYNLDFFTFTAVPGPGCTGDVNDDGSTDVFDFGDLAANFGAGPGATRAMGDLNDDGFVNVFDFGVLASDFGCESP